MKNTLKSLSATRKQLDIEISSDSLREIRDDVLSQLNQTAKVPGFRPGKVPADLLEKHYSRHIKEEIIRKAIPEFFRQAADANNIIPVNLPDIDNVSFDNNILKFTAVVDVKPRLNIPERVYKGIKLERKDIKIDSGEIDKVQKSFEDNLKKLTKKEEVSGDFLAKWLGYRDINEYKSGIEREIWINKFLQRRRDIENKVMKHLLANVKIEAPASVVEQQKKNLVQKQIMSLQEKGVKKEDIDKYKEEIEKKMEPAAVEQVKLYYIMEQIARQEGFWKDEAEDLFEKVLGFIFANAR